MGYATDYKLEAGPFDNEEAAEFFEFKLRKDVSESFETEIGLSCGTKHTGSYYLKMRASDAYWYGYATDLKTLSEKFPSITIDVVGEGEESGDIWKARFRNGEYEQVDAIVAFPDFEKLT